MGALGGWVGAGLAGLGSLGIEGTEARIEVGPATSAAAQTKYVDASRATALGEHGASVADVANGSAAVSNPPAMPQPATPSVLSAAMSSSDPVQTAARPAVSSE